MCRELLLGQWCPFSCSGHLGVRPAAESSVAILPGPAQAEQALRHPGSPRNVPDVQRELGPMASSCRVPGKQRAQRDKHAQGQGVASPSPLPHTLCPWKPAKSHFPTHALAQNDCRVVLISSRCCLCVLVEKRWFLPHGTAGSPLLGLGGSECRVDSG